MTQVWMGVWFPQLLLQYQRYRLARLGNMAGSMTGTMTDTMTDTMTGSMAGSGAAQVQTRVQTQFQTQNQPKAVPTAAASEPFDPQVPMALYDSRKLVIHSACPAAQAKGVTAGMSVGSAQSLLGELQLWPLQEVDSEALRDWLCQWSYDFSARIWPPLLSGLTEQAAPYVADARWPTDTLLLEVGSMVKLFGSLSAIVEAYLNKVADYGLECSLVLAHRPLDAAILARHTHVGISAVSAAFMSSPTAEKAGHLKVHHGLPPDLPLDLLPLTQEERQRLGALGLTTLAMLDALPLAELGRRFGQGLLQLLAQIQGRLPCCRKGYELPEQFQARLTLLHDVEWVQGLLFPLQKLLGELATYLRIRQLAVQHLELWLKFREPEPPALQLTLNYPFGEYQLQGLSQLCRLQLEGLQLPSPVVDIELRSRQFVSQQLGSRELTESREGQQQDANQLLARLQARLGSHKVRSLVLAADPMPELASTAAPLTRWPPPARLPVQPSLALRPLWLLQEPQAIAPEAVELLRGPERLQSPWHSGPFPCRDYFLAHHKESGGLCWLFRTANGLFLHAWFS
ncbi:Y-family DNA polymerase [Shewanella chilikensis]|uniref:Y-family DNA polymerase n=1 Tax=Shewanella chilikensis TaxID=558541 RepID=UPI00399AE702